MKKDQKSKVQELGERIDEIFRQHGHEVKYDKEKKGFCVQVKIKIPTSKFIFHIPHASLEIPKEFKERLLVDEDYFMKENTFISDYKIDEFIPKDFPNVVKFNYSRMFCDVEKYLDNDKEEMSKYGMGAIYTKDSNGLEFIKLDNNYKNNIINNYYKKHHDKLDYKVKQILSFYNDAIIIDLHSFSDEFVEKVLNKTNCPDICIGINESNCDLELLTSTVNYFSLWGYSVMVNYPYSGSIISNKYPEVKSIMIEINKRVYLNNTEGYKKLKTCMMNYCDMLEVK